MSVSVPSALTAGWDLWESWLVPGLALVADMREKSQQHCCHPPVTAVFNVLPLRASKICSQSLLEVLEHRGCLWIICAMFFSCAATLCTCKRITEGISLTLSEIWVLPWHQPQRARQSLAVPSPVPTGPTFHRIVNHGDPSLLGDGICTSLATMCSPGQSCALLIPSAPLALPSSPGISASQHQDKSYKAEPSSWPHELHTESFR